MAAINLSAKEGSAWANNRKAYEVVEGESITFSITYSGATAVSSVSAKVYRRTTDVTSSVMPSGSTSASGNVATLKPVTAMVGGNDYVVAVTATVDGNTRIKKFTIKCQKDEAKQ